MKFQGAIVWDWYGYLNHNYGVIPNDILDHAKTAAEMWVWAHKDCESYLSAMERTRKTSTEENKKYWTWLIDTFKFLTGLK